MIKTCDRCQGSGMIMDGDNSVACPNCHGVGKLDAPGVCSLCGHACAWHIRGSCIGKTGLRPCPCQENY